jgi:hypothetical protein
MAKRKGTNNDLQNITHKTKDVRVIRTPLKTGGERRCYVRITSSCCTSDTDHVNLVTNPVISHEWRQDREVFSTSWTYSWSFVIQIFHNGQPIYGDDRKDFRSDDFNLTNRNPWISSFLVISNPLSRKSW